MAQLCWQMGGAEAACRCVLGGYSAKGWKSSIQGVHLRSQAREALATIEKAGGQAGRTSQRAAVSALLLGARNIHSVCWRSKPSAKGPWRPDDWSDAGRLNPAGDRGTGHQSQPLMLVEFRMSSFPPGGGAVEFQFSCFEWCSRSFDCESEGSRPLTSLNFC